ncbi:MAG: 30S ribosomal protein S26e [Promethearchaeota archaeon]
MPKKRKNSGKNKIGKDQFVQCEKCGRSVPKSKAKRVTRRVRYAEAVIERELRKQGTIMPMTKVSKWLCVSCAIHSHTVKIRSEQDRKKKESL